MKDLGPESCSLCNCNSTLVGLECVSQILMTATSGDVIGEIGVLCYMPQPFTVRSRKLSQLLRLDRAVFMNVVQSFEEDGQRIVDNLLQVTSPFITFSVSQTPEIDH